MPSRKAKSGTSATRAVRRASPGSGLQAYRRKRDFSRTPEPSGKGRKTRGNLVYSFQLHEASHLHYDLRLQEGSVLKSWAVPKGPPSGPGERRLAVETEDHPLDYAFFEGTIPEGEYGAGTVRVWDRGTYEPVETSPGKRVVRIRGRKLKGTFVLVKIRAKEGQKDINWLFFRAKDDAEPHPHDRTKP
jgi:bifunctional non-homologous end joining protein LigD